MTIDEAIEILTENIKAKPPGMSHDYFDAIQLGIEGLERILNARKGAGGWYLGHLPSETEK